MNKFIAIQTIKQDNIEPKCCICDEIVNHLYFELVIDKPEDIGTISHRQTKYLCTKCKDFLGGWLGF